MLEHWFQETPREPMQDVHRMAAENDHDKVLSFVQGIDPRSKIPLRWNPLQLALTWTDKKKTVEVMEELVVLGADLNTVALSGINALHLLILLFFFRNQADHDHRMLEWWLSKGVDIHTMAMVYDTRKNSYRVFSPLDLLLALSQKTLSMKISDYVPSFVEGIRKRGRRPKPTTLRRLVALFLCYGAKASETSPLLEEVVHTLHTFPFSSTPFLRDYMETRLKFPLHLSLHDLKSRLEFLQQHVQDMDMEQIVETREAIFFAHDDAGQTLYANPCFEPRAEFMPYEYLGYREDKEYFFHKSMIPSILQTRENPFTRHAIPHGILRKWFHQMSQRPFFFGVHMLRESRKDNALVLWEDAISVPNTTSTMLHFVHHILAPSFPYTNILRVSHLAVAEFIYLCQVLSRDPYRLDAYTKCGDVPTFLQHTMAYLMDADFPMEALYFGVEEALLDMGTYHLVVLALKKENSSFQDPFLDIILGHPSVGDLLRDRIGYVHLDYFREIWQRLLSLHKIFLEKN